MLFQFPSQERRKQIMVLSLPIVGGMISQNVLNLVDTAMVGQLGSVALAAVGLGGMVNFLSQSLLLGVSTGVQAMAARRLGEGRESEAGYPLNAALLLVLIVGFFLTAFVYNLIPVVFPYLNPDPKVCEQGAIYVQTRVLAATFVGMNFAFRGFWNAIQMPSVYMRTLVMMHLVNIFLNWVFIFGNLGMPALGVQGAAMGTAISTAFGAFLYIVQAFYFASDKGFFKSLSSAKSVIRLVQLSLPNSIQQCFFSGGLTALFWIIGQIDTVSLAATHILINLLLVCILPGMGMGLAAGSLAGKSLGAQDPDDAHSWGIQVALMAFLLISIPGIFLGAFPDRILGVFTVDLATIHAGSLPLRLTGLFIGLDAAGLVMMNSLLGVGDARRVMFISIFSQWFVFLPLAYLCGPVLGFGLLSVWVLQGLYRVMQGFFFFILWNKRKWVHISV